MTELLSSFRKVCRGLYHLLVYGRVIYPFHHSPSSSRRPVIRGIDSPKVRRQLFLHKSARARARIGYRVTGSSEGLRFYAGP